MNNLDDGVLFEVLTRVAESGDVIRCAAVCRRWSSVISLPQFLPEFVRRRTGTSTGPIPPVFLIQWHGLSFPSEVSDPDPRFHQILSVDSRDDPAGSAKCPILSYLSFLPLDSLVRASFHDLLLVSNNADSKFFICNPATRQILALPDPPAGEFEILRCGLAPRGNDGHLVVVLFGYYPWSEPDSTWVSVLDTGIGRWTPPRENKEVPLQDGCLICNNLVVACGSEMFWLLPLRRTMMLWDGVVAFNPSSGRCRYIPRPPPSKPQSYSEFEHVLLGACRDKVRVMMLNGARLSVWELSGEASWSVVVHREMLQLDNNEERRHRCLYPVAHHPSNGNVVFFLRGGLRVIRYDMVRRSGRVVGQYSNDFGRNTFRLSVYAPYVHSSIPTPLPVVNYSQ